MPHNRMEDVEILPMCQVPALPKDGMTVLAGDRDGVAMIGTGDLCNEGVCT